MTGILIVVSVLFLIIVVAAGSSQSSNSNVEKKPVRRRISYEKILHSNDEGTYFLCEVQGTYYRSRDAIERARILDVDEPLRLETEPLNPVDRYAIKIQTMDGFDIGYIPKEYARCLNSNMDAFVDCFVDRVVNAVSAPYVYVRVFFNRITTVHYMEVVKDVKKRHYYESKYKGFSDRYYTSQETYLQNWTTYLKENPDDFFIKYYYADALENAGKWDEATEFMMSLLQEYNLIDWESFENKACFVSRMAERTQQAEVHDELILKHAEGKRLFEKKEYEKALELFKECLPLKQQLVPRNICKCYEKLGMQEELYDFVIDILKEEWITVNNRILLEKYIQ